MKKLVSIAVFALAAVVCAPAQQSSQNQPSLGDVARQQRPKDQGAQQQKVWTNDDFPDRPADATGVPAEPGTGDAKTADAADKKGDAKGKDAKEKDSKKTVDDDQQAAKEWQGKVDQQKAKVASLQREQDLTDREYKLFATKYYADAGNRLRDQKDFHDQEQQYRDKLNQLKDQITEEQAKLSDLQEQARKSGVKVE